MLSLADILELIENGLDKCAFAQEQFVGERQEDVAHVLAQVRDEAQALRKEELLSQRRRDVAFVAKEFAKEPMDHAWNRLAVVEIARSEAEGEQLSTIIHHHMQFEAVEPPHRGLPSTRVDCKDTMLVDPRRMADSEGGRIDEADACAWPTLDVQVDGQGHEEAWHQVDKAGIADQLWKLVAQMDLDVLAIEPLERPIARLLKENEDGQDLAGVQPRRSSTSALSGGEQFAFPQRLEALPKRIYRATPLNELVAGDLIAGAVLTTLLALVFSSSVINPLFATLRTGLSVTTCTVSWPIGPCFQGGTLMDLPTLSFLDVLQALIYLPLGLLLVALSGTLRGLESTAESVDSTTQPYAESVIGALRSALSRSLRPSFSPYFTALALRNLLWPPLDFIAIFSLAAVARELQLYFHLLSDSHSCGSAGSLPCTYVNVTLLSAEQPYISLVSALALGAIAVMASTFATALLIFRRRVVQNTFRFLGALGSQVMVTYWMFAAALAVTNLILLAVGVSSRVPFPAPEPLAIASLASALLVGQRSILRSIRVFYQGNDRNLRGP